MVVDLPAPLAPRKPKIAPRLTSKLTASTAVNAPKRFVSDFTSMEMIRHDRPPMEKPR